MRTSSLAQKRGSRNMIQHAEFRYSSSGAVVSLTSYDGDTPASETGVHQSNKAMCRYSENHEKLSTRLQNQGRNFSDAALELAATYLPLSPSGDEEVSGQQSIAAHIRTIKECTVRMRFSARKNCGSGDDNQRAASNEVWAMTSLFTIRNPTSLPRLQVAAYIDILEQRAMILRTAKKNLARSEKKSQGQELNGAANNSKDRCPKPSD